MDGNNLILHSPVGFVVAFGGGIISFLSPCVLPLVPSYLCMMSGVSSADLVAASRLDQRRLLRSTLLFVAGFTAVFAALEATASGLGRTLQSHVDVLNHVAGALIIVAGLLFAGLVSPAWVMRERRFHVAPSRLGEWAAPVMGMAFAFGWTPCIGPVLAAVLALSSDSHTLGRGEAMLVAYSLGTGGALRAGWCGIRPSRRRPDLRQGPRPDDQPRLGLAARHPRRAAAHRQSAHSLDVVLRRPPGARVGAAVHGLAGSRMEARGVL